MSLPAVLLTGARAGRRRPWLARVLLCLLLVAAVDAFAAIGLEELPPGTLTAQELLKLFSNQTVVSATAVRERGSVSYYDPNGELRQQRLDVTRHGRWRVTEDARICLQMEDLPEKCRIVVLENGVYKKYIVKKNGEHQHSVTYLSFRKGNPLGL